ncbi:hypothetical protein Ahy_B01g054925 [Arachis hypogaea]|uniref:Uncharacterized protein n=1 Tax=Arachis hypogaea TaxID=3818 RepID=A0A445AUN9_ARAHY|nr:hypothetical protein Ahy_B01g054925 [Arachis hypogaea]
MFLSSSPLQDHSLAASVQFNPVLVVESAPVPRLLQAACACRSSSAQLVSAIASSQLVESSDSSQHRSSLRHLRHLLSTLSSRVVLSLLPPVLTFTTFAAAIAAYKSAVSAHFLLPEYFPVLRASSLLYQLTAPALALLLIF